MKKEQTRQQLATALLDEEVPAMVGVICEFRDQDGVLAPPNSLVDNAYKLARIGQVLRDGPGDGGSDVQRETPGVDLDTTADLVSDFLYVSSSDSRLFVFLPLDHWRCPRCRAKDRLGYVEPMKRDTARPLDDNNYVYARHPVLCGDCGWRGIVGEVAIAAILDDYAIPRASDCSDLMDVMRRAANRIAYSAEATSEGE